MRRLGYWRDGDGGLIIQWRAWRRDADHVPSRLLRLVFWLVPLLAFGLVFWHVVRHSDVPPDDTVSPETCSVCGIQFTHGGEDTAPNGDDASTTGSRGGSPGTDHSA
jgi:hypothetical protein